MSLQQLRQEIQKFRADVEVKTKLPWDCINLMNQYQTDCMRQRILALLHVVEGQSQQRQEPYRLEVEDHEGLSSKALEFLSLSTEDQENAVNSYYPPVQSSEEEAEEARKSILKKLYGNSIYSFD